MIFNTQNCKVLKGLGKKDDPKIVRVLYYIYVKKKKKKKKKLIF